MRTGSMVCLSVLAAACGKSSLESGTAPAEPPQAAVAEPTPAVAPASATETRWFQCGPNEATKLLVTQLTIPDNLERQRCEIWLIAEPLYETSGRLNFRHGGDRGVLIACGTGGYLHQSVAVVDEGTSLNQVVVRIYYAWGSSEPKLHGTFEQTIPFEVDRATRVPLKGGAFLDVSWRDVVR